ncbi:hypothetical protein G6F57_008596 [Rhizopus arrhizus]|nr:hypothetical protein G6F34_009481 [Rhizopus arrhizus]KAG0935651.1 hypothetical protein G6F32_010334 [Rhizopus arrhizus]KAG1020160.1 hypothetical protein G6F26_009518 [Rhizopus arrhizus]KAG1092180.1 hypothetical protein G6F39_009474 [Rhizopus arrhizus]KAG1187359.1 hypothetical protein G6F36_005480 [Rhizopus arrhizus]
MKSASSRKLRSKKQVNNQNKQEEMDNTTSSKRKNATLTTRKKRPRVRETDEHNPVKIAINVKGNNRVQSHRNQTGNTQPPVWQTRGLPVTTPRHGLLHCIEFWKEQKRVAALSEADSNCSDVINKFLVKNSEEVLASAENFHKPAIKDTTTSSSATKETPTSETPTSVTSEAPTSATSETSTSGTVTTTTSSAFTIDSSNNELDLKHYMLGGSDITALFRQYQNRADKILRPIILETYVQELLALGDVLFLAKNQHSNIKTSFFSEELLDKLLDNQNQVLLNKILDTYPDFTTEDYMAVLKVLTSIDQNIITPKQAKLELLTLAAGMDSLKGNVIEGIGDLLTKLPLDSIVEKDKIGEVDIQTRYYEPLLSAILADTTKKVILRWPNKMDETAPEIRPDAIISTLIQLKFGRHLGYGEVKPGDNSTTTQSLCVDTLKLTVLSRNTCLKNEHPILAFQINGFQLIFYVTQRIHHRFYTMIEIGRVKVPDSLLSIQSFATLKNLQILLRVTQIFWHCCHSVPFPNDSPLLSHSSSLGIDTLLNMANSSNFKYRNCPIQYY